MESKPTERRAVEVGKVKEAIMEAIEEQGRMTLMFPDGTTYRVGQFIGVVSCVQAYNSKGKREEKEDATYEESRVIIHGPFTAMDRAAAKHALQETMLKIEMKEEDEKNGSDRG